MALIPTPAGLYFTDVEIWNDRVSAAMVSPYTGAQQIQKLPWDAWGFTGGLLPYDPAKAGLLKSFLMQLAGKVNTFKLPVPGSKYPISNYTGVEGLVNGAGQTGRSIITDGWAINKPIVAEGDHFNIGDELFVATSAVASNGTGQATLTFEPPMKAIPANNAPMKVKEPFLLLRATRDDIARWKITAPVRHAMQLEAMEAI